MKIEPQALWPYLDHVCDWEFFLKKSKPRPFFQNLKSTKIKSITVFIHKKNAKYLTKCKSAYFDVEFSNLE